MLAAGQIFPFFIFCYLRRSNCDSRRVNNCLVKKKKFFFFSLFFQRVVSGGHYGGLNLAQARNLWRNLHEGYLPVKYFFWNTLILFSFFLVCYFFFVFSISSQRVWDFFGSHSRGRWRPHWIEILYSSFSKNLNIFLIYWTPTPSGAQNSKLFSFFKFSNIFFKTERLTPSSAQIRNSIPFLVISKSKFFFSQRNERLRHIAFKIATSLYTSEIVIFSFYIEVVRH